MSHGHSNMPMPMPMPSGSNSTYNYNGTTMFMDHMIMPMSFFWGKDVVVLFSGWPGFNRLGMYILALAMVFFLAAGAEILSLASSLKPRGLSPAVGALIHAVVFAVRIAMGYLVMLSVMSFNLGVFVAAVAGDTAGSFFLKYRELRASVNPGSNSAPKF
ncbi:hypothetical protein RD792_013990 [Penstemon davidsonii]|uniref:Copper transport protein n=1 Tax=Penstemon davidsonii TaxID=160366 RepID=A0ABR0CPN4_9LAMI|nr:hypothetical protein RD792_013990 [Penstemon davidsonii]